MSEIAQILQRLEVLEEKFRRLVDPEHIDLANKAAIIRRAHASGDKQQVRAAIKRINGRGL
jgi:hypothetical protein